MKNIWVAERTRLILAILDNSRARTAKCFKWSGWLLNSAKRLCQQTMSQSLMMIHWKLFKLQNELQSALWDLAGYRTWPRYFANKHFHKVWWLYNENYWIYSAEKMLWPPPARRVCSHNTSHFFLSIWSYCKEKKL